MPDTSRWDRWAFPAGMALATLAGVVLRAWHLAIPLRYDEAVTFMEYASGGLAQAVTEYHTPNNHVLNSLLIHGTTSLFGSDPFAIRLPAFAAGCALVPATAWMAARRFDRRVAFVAALLVAATPVLVEYSVNARGYSLVGLLTVVAAAVGTRLLERPSAAGWAGLGLAGVAGLYTLPVMLLPWAGISVWLAVNLFSGPEPDPLDRDVGGGGRADEGDTGRGDRAGEGEPTGRRVRRVIPLVVVNAVAAAVVVLLYWPIARKNGWEALVANRVVTELPWDRFVGAVPGVVAAVGGHWARGVPEPVPLLVGAALLAALLLGRREGERLPLGWAALLTAVVVLVAKRNPGRTRIWLWALPIVLTAASAGLVSVLDRTLGRRLASLAASGIAAVCFGVVATHLVIDRPLWRSLETGGFMEVESVAAWLAARAGPGDAILTDFVSREPLDYYLARRGLDPDALARRPGEEGRVWVIVNLNEEERRARVMRDADRLGIPLRTARPMATFGNVHLFGFGRSPEGFP